MIGNGVLVLLACVSKSNMFMSHDTLYRCTKGRTIERGPPLAGERHRAGRRRLGSVTRFWIVSAASLSLPRRGGGDRPSRPRYRARCANHAEDPRQRRARSAQLFGGERTDAWRNCCECHFEVPQGNAQAWLRAARERTARFASTTPLIVCSPRNFSKPMRSFSSAARRWVGWSRATWTTCSSSRPRSCRRHGPPPPSFPTTC